MAYRVAIPQPAKQYVHVEMQVTASGPHTDVAMPAWTPGSYLIRDFARHVYDLQAQTGDGQPLRVERRDKQTWRIHHRQPRFVVRYRVFAAQRSVRTSFVDDRGGLLNGASLFLYLVTDQDRPCEVELQLPDGWEAHTALPRTGAGPNRIELSAGDYDRLVDGPIAVGQAQVRSFEVDGTRFEYVVRGLDDSTADLDRLAGDARRIVTAFGRLMGGFPMTRYVFLVELNDTGGGGLEHADSTAMMMRRDIFDGASGYHRAARLAAHEFFHLWNVKRIHDRALGPFDYARENHSHLLWFHEGFTETAEGLALVRAGLVAPEEHVRQLGERWTRYRRRPGRNHAPLTELSFEAWTKAYQPAKNHPNVAVSYYEKGGLIGVALDLEIRRRAARHDAQGDLFGVFRRLMRTHGARAKGITLRDIVDASSAEAHEDMGWFFDRYVKGTEELDLPAVVESIGVRIREDAPWRKRKDDEKDDEKDDTDEDDTDEDDSPRRLRKRTWAGLDLRGNEVSNVVPGSPAARAGMMREDEIVAVDGHRTDDEDAIRRWLAHAGPDHDVELSFFRDDGLRRQRVHLVENPHRVWTFDLEPVDALEPPIRGLRDRWLAVDASPG